MKLNSSNLHRFLTTSALFAMAEFFCLTNLAPMAKAEDINVSNGNELIEAIQKAGTNTANLQNNITATGNLGNLAGTQLTIDGGENTRFGISGTYETYIHYEGIIVGSEQKLIINNVGSVDETTGTILNSWNGFARNDTNFNAFASASASGGAIYNHGTVEITGSSFSNNYATADATADATATATADAYAYAYAYGGAIYNVRTATITDSSFSNNSATATAYAAANADADADADARGGAIYNQEGDVNIIASTKDSVFSGNYTEGNGRKTNNDIYNFGTLELPGTINLYAASDKTISFDGGIVSEGPSSFVNINVNGEGTTYNVAGTVLFKTGSINSDNNFTLGAGTLKLESGVSQNWLNNSLTQTGGTLDLANGAIETTNFKNFDSRGGNVILDIDLAMGRADEINVTGTLTNAAEIGNINFITTNIADTTKSIAIGNGLHLTGRKDIVSETTLANNYIKVWLAQSETISNSLDVVRFQSINAAISDSSAGNRKIELVGDITPTANLGDLEGTQLTIDGGENTKFGISGTYQENGTEKHYKGITVGSGKTLIINNVKSWNGFKHYVNSASAYADASRGAIYNYFGMVEITDSSFSNNSAYAYASTYASSYGGTIYNNSNNDVAITILQARIFLIITPPPPPPPTPTPEVGQFATVVC